VLGGLVFRDPALWQEIGSKGRCRRALREVADVEPRERLAHVREIDVRQTLASGSNLARVLPAVALVKACALLTAAELASVQGEKPIRVRPSSPPHGGSQCLFVFPTAAKSVSLEVSRGPRATEFADRLRVAAETEGDEAAEGEQPAVERVPGVGDDAWWAGPVGGLYVRQRDTLLRIAIGGKDSKEAKLGKLRLLAGKALSRLPK
jgi:hypothetical protein